MFVLIVEFGVEGVRGWKTEGEQERVWPQTRVAWARWKKERMAALGVQLETMRGAVWDKYRLLDYTSHSNTPPHAHTHTHKNRTKRLVTAKFTGVTSTISLASNSPVYSGYSCYEQLIIVLCLVPVVLLPSDSDSLTHTGNRDSIQSNIAAAAGQETPVVRACSSGNMRFRTSWYKNYAILDMTDRGDQRGLSDSCVLITTYKKRLWCLHIRSIFQSDHIN